MILHHVDVQEIKGVKIDHFEEVSCTAGSCTTVGMKVKTESYRKERRTVGFYKMCRLMSSDLKKRYEYL